MSIVNEHDFEQELIELIKNKLNWNYFNSEEISKEQINYSNNGFYYLHKNKFENSIKKLNPNIEEQYINKAISKVKTIISGTNLDISAKEAFNFLIKGIKIDNNDKNKSTLVIKLIDFENIKNNDFSFTNQLKVKTSDPNKKIQIPDVIFYINGLPVIVGELKNPIIEDDNWFEKALNQINNYKKYCHISLFSFNFLNFISNKEISKYSSVTNDNADYYFWWKKMDKKNKNLEWDFFFEKLLNPKILFDLFCNFSYYPNNDKFKNKRTLASYHQFYGTNDSVEKAKNSFENNDNKIGIYWHTQGSGKSQSMIFFAHKMIKKYPKLTTLVITDRKDLDGQLYFTFQNAGDFLHQDIIQVKSIKDLVENLKNRIQNGIFFSTVQKFDDSVGELSNREDILIITDEAHRSQRVTEDQKTNASMYSIKKQELYNEENTKNSYAAYLREAFPNAKFIGYTGTPIENLDDSNYRTVHTFGDYISKYSMSDAIEDGFTVPIVYQHMGSNMSIHEKEKLIYEAQKKYEYIISKLENETGDGVPFQRAIDKEFKNLESFLNIDERIDNIVDHFIQHYESRKNLLKGKALFVAFSIKIAMKYYKKILQKKPEWKDKIKLIVTIGNSTNADKELNDLAVPDGQAKSIAANNFKNDDDSFKIAIVVDMWLTGFDVPSLDTIYLDSHKKMHNLMQTIARVNRVYIDKKTGIRKEAGLVVDYFGIVKELKKAIEIYSDISENKLKKSNDFDLRTIKQNLIKLVDNVLLNFNIDKISIIREYKNSNNTSSEMYDKIFNQLILNNVFEKNVTLYNGQEIKSEKLFRETCENINKNFQKSISILDNDFKILCQILVASSRVLANKLFALSEFNIKSKEIQDIKKDIFNSITINKPINFNLQADLRNLKLQNILEIISNNSFQNLENLEKQKNIQIIDFYLESIRNAIKTGENKLAEDIQKLLDKYKNNLLSREEFIENFKELIKEELEKEQEIEDLEIENWILKDFYHILSRNQGDLTKWEKNTIKKILNELYETVCQHIDKTWIDNNDLKSLIKGELRIILIKNNFPPETSNLIKEDIAKEITTIFDEKINSEKDIKEIFKIERNE